MPPDPPSNITITNKNATSISLNWNTGFDGNSPLVNVSISYWSSNYPNDGTQYVLLPLVYSSTLSGLHPNANYSIRITLVNALGVSSTLVTLVSSTLSLSELLLLYSFAYSKLVICVKALVAPSVSALYAINSTQLAMRWMVSVCDD